MKASAIHVSRISRCVDKKLTQEIIYVTHLVCKRRSSIPPHTRSGSDDEKGLTGLPKHAEYHRG